MTLSYSATLAEGFDELRDRLDETIGSLAMDVVFHPLDDLEPASQDCCVRGMGMLDGDDAIFRTPDDKRRYPGGQVEFVGRAHRLPTRVNDGAQRAQARSRTASEPGSVSIRSRGLTSEPSPAASTSTNRSQRSGY